MKKQAMSLILGAVFALPLLADRSDTGDRVVVPVGQQGADIGATEKPRRGITRSQVRSRFGEPESIRQAVGDPPISAWEYPDYIVYFEHDLVLHSVIKRNRQAANNPDGE